MWKKNGSRQHPGTWLYVRPYNLSVRVQPSDGEIGKQLPVQPQIIFLDKKVGFAPLWMESCITLVQFCHLLAKSKNYETDLNIGRRIVSANKYGKQGKG